MIDYIYSLTKQRVYAKINYQKEGNIDYYYSANLLEYCFPEELMTLITEYNGIVEDMVISLLDIIEKKIYTKYDLVLYNSKTRIFNLSIPQDNKMYFFTKYPTSRGFRDQY
ncbi:unnamed protein product [Commensalibacter communis]|uniref:hypothetical protein n=1 Tax=Commensalibacter communis TaxID=2972786 RepID=UPI0022FFA19A|nr:hypothetical protein [Commensalibacter communis]CAI3956840.1 unnamed protein product [Commensalibacter communis]